jgi:hypothetical protein
MMADLVFYFYAGTTYLAVAFLGSMYAAYREYQLSHPSTAVQPAKVVKSSFPPGQVAYCSPCDRYFLEDRKALEHQRGKRHADRATGHKNPMEFRPKELAQSQPEKVSSGGNSRKDKRE